jgi:hypothetical protein
MKTIEDMEWLGMVWKGPVVPLYGITSRAILKNLEFLRLFSKAT